METLGAYIPVDRRLAMVKGKELPNRTTGAALFADLSRFSPMTRDLVEAFGPKRGAEELTRQLNVIYGAIIQNVHRYQGAVVNFSGDAITCWFDKDDGQRAIASGLAMLRSQYNFIKRPTGETIPLALKIGVATGAVRRFRVGNPLIQFIDVLAGATLNRMAAAEQQANRGQLVVDAATANTLKGLVQVGQWLKTKQPTRADDTPTIPDFAVVTALTETVKDQPWPRTKAWQLTERQTRPWLLPPVYTRLRSVQSRFLDEIRPAVALFLKFDGLDYDEDDTAGDKLNFYIEWVQNVLVHHSGYLIQLTTGDKGSYLYAAFGAPVAHEDYTDQAVAAALELRQPPPEIEFISQVQIGLSRGWMHAGAYGSQTRRTYGVLGDETNVAARLMSQAKPEQILITSRVVSALSQNYKLQQLARVSNKGKAGAISVLEVLGRQWNNIKKNQSGQKTPIIGRAAEQDRLRQRLQALQDNGEGRVIIIEGEAGMGKSSLVSELIAMVRACDLIELSGTGRSNEQQTLYRAWNDILSTYFNLETGSTSSATRQTSDEPALYTHQKRVQNQVKFIAPEQVERLPLLNEVLGLNLPHTNLTVSLEPAMRHQGLVTLLVTLFRARAKDQPLILLLDDAQWLDSLSWDLVIQVTRSLIASGDPFLLVLATRPLNQQTPEARHMAMLQNLDETETITLPPLTSDETVALVTARLGLSPNSLPPLVAEIVHQRAGGNPFFAEELTHALLDQGLIKIEPVAEPKGAVPNDGHRNHCLVVGDLTHAAGVLPDTLQSLILARIDRLPPGSRLALKVAAVIGLTFAYAPLYHTLSHHAPIKEDRLKNDLNLLVLADLTMVGHLAPNPLYIFKHIITQEVAYQTLVFVQRCKLHHIVAEWYEQTHGVTDGIQASQSHPGPSIYPLLVYHYRHAENRKRERHYARLAGEQAATQFANKEAIAYFNRALELTPETDYSERYAVLLAREKVYSLQGQRNAQIETLTILEHLAELLDDDYKRAEVAFRRSVLAEAISDYAATIEAAQSAIELAKRAKGTTIEAWGYLMWGTALWRQGNYQTAQEQLEQGLSLTSETSELEARILRTMGLVYWHQGNYTSAKNKFEQTLLIFQNLGIKQGEGLALNNLGIIMAEQGNPNQAKTFFEQSLLLCQQIGDRKLEGNILNNLGIVAERQGDYIRAQGNYRQALQIKREIGDRQGEAMALDNLGNTVKHQGNYAQARAYFEQSLFIRREKGERLGEANVLNNLGNVAHKQGDYTRARLYYRQSLFIRRKIGDQQGEGEVLSCLSLLFHHLEDHDIALKYARHALQIVNSLGDRHLQGYVLTHLGHVWASLGHWSDSLKTYQQALTLRHHLGERNLAMEPLAGLARVYLAQKNISLAQAQVAEILEHLQHRTLDGTEEPFRVYLTCYDVLAAAQQASRARNILDRAYHLLQKQATKLESPTLRRDFLANVAAHHRLAAAWQREKSNDSVSISLAERGSLLTSH